MISLFPPKIPASTELLVDGAMVSVTVRISARARNYRLSIPHGGQPVLTVPAKGRWSDAQAFLLRQSGWLATRLPLASKPIAMGHGDTIAVRGVDHRICALGNLRGRVQIASGDDGPVLMVPGAPEHLQRRLIDWLKTEAQADLAVRVSIHAKTLGVVARSITLRSQSTRWGSCSSTGSLNFNWRLIVAPPFVLDYVAAHEVAHLVEMNHSPAFWTTVARTLPDMDRGRAWLKTHGRHLMAYGL